jgi:Sulfotransferase domain
MMSLITKRTLEWLFVVVMVTVMVRFYSLTTRTLQSLLRQKDMDYIGRTMTSSVGTVSSYPSKIPQYVIDQAQRRAEQFNATAAIDEVRILVNNFPAFRNIAKEYQPQGLWKQTHFPDVNIAGLQKAGSSQLYNILTSHSDMYKFHSFEKEFPFGIPHLSLNISKLLLLSQHDMSDVAKRSQITSIQRLFHSRFKTKAFQKLTENPQTSIERTTTEASSTTKMLSVNACLDTTTAMMMRQYLGRTLDSKLIFMVRDPADWLWSSYNFWTYRQHIDLLNSTTRDWAAAPQQYRSPEIFHEMLLAGADRFGPTAELIGVLRDRINNLFSRVIAAAHQINANSVLVVKTEDMAPDRIHSSEFIENLAKFLGVTLDGFDESILKSFSNCGNSRGTGSRCSKASSAYAVAGNRAMLEQSRDLVYLYFAEECKLWAEEFGVVYERCLRVSDQYHIHDKKKV